MYLLEDFINTDNDALTSETQADDEIVAGVHHEQKSRSKGTLIIRLILSNFQKLPWKLRTILTVSF